MSVRSARAVASRRSGDTVKVDRAAARATANKGRVSPRSWTTTMRSRIPAARATSTTTSRLACESLPPLLLTRLWTWFERVQCSVMGVVGVRPFLVDWDDVRCPFEVLSEVVVVE